MTDTVANATKPFDLATKNSSLYSRHFGDYVPLIKKTLKARNNFVSLISFLFLFSAASGQLTFSFVNLFVTSKENDLTCTCGLKIRFI